MRKLMITASLAAVALAGLAACADNSVSPSSSQSASTPASASATTSAADQTKQVCLDAAAAGSTASTELQAKFVEAQAANGDQMKLVQIAGDAARIAGQWSTKLTELSAKPIDPDVKAALTEGATTIQGLTNPATMQSLTPVAAAAQLQGVITKITTACA